MASSDTRPITRPSRGWRALSLALALAACHDGSDEARCAEGTDGCLCAADGACGLGLDCEDGRCVGGAPDASSPDTGPDGRPDAVMVEVESEVEVEGGDVTRDAGPDGPELPCSGDPVADFCACRENADCASGFCLPSSAGGRVCSRTCSGTCPNGFDCLFVTLPGLDPTYLCVEPDLNLCRPCTDDAECQRDAFGASGARCVRHGDGAGSFCGVACREDAECPASYACREVEALETGGLIRQCVPAEAGGSCGCSGRSIEDAAFTTCAVGGCTGTRRCEEEGLSPCSDPDGAICEPPAGGVSGVRLHLPGAAVQALRPGATGLFCSAGHGGPTGRANNGKHWIHFGFHPGLPR